LLECDARDHRDLASRAAAPVTARSPTPHSTDTSPADILHDCIDPSCSHMLDAFDRLLVDARQIRLVRAGHLTGGGYSRPGMPAPYPLQSSSAWGTSRTTVAEVSCAVRPRSPAPRLLGADLAERDIGDHRLAHDGDVLDAIEQVDALAAHRESTHPVRRSLQVRGRVEAVVVIRVAHVQLATAAAFPVEFRLVTLGEVAAAPLEQVGRGSQFGPVEGVRDRATIEYERRRQGRGWRVYEDRDLIFADELGRPINPQRVTETFAALARPPGSVRVDCTTSGIRTRRTCSRAGSRFTSWPHGSDTLRR
jgi:hypothetical protein